MQKVLSFLGTVIFTALVTSGVTFYFQRNFLSKVEEKNLIRELIPSLTSNEPSQVDMALLILEKSINEKDYLVIKKIVDSKVEAIAAKSYVSIEKNPAIAIPSQREESKKTKVNAFANQRDDWKKIITDKEDNLTKPLKREDLIKLLDSIDGMTTDNVQKQINLEIAKKINNEDFFAAIVGLDWMLHFHNDRRYRSLKGILKNSLKPDQRALLEFYFKINGYDDLIQIAKFRNLVVIDLDEDLDKEATAGTDLDKINKSFLADIKKENAFRDLFSSPKRNTYKSKFENVK